MESDSSYYETTYSEDERIEEYIREKRRQEIADARNLEKQREVEFTEYYKSEVNNKKSIFNLPGVEFMRFSSRRIKFSFHACKVARVSKRVIFYVSLRYRKGHWLLKHDSVPVNYKLRVYSLFYTNGSFRFEDEDIPACIVEIWRILVKWAKDEAKFRQEKFKARAYKHVKSKKLHLGDFQRYQDGDEDVYIDEDDEDLFLSDDEVEELHRKREAIWNRMRPPPPIKENEDLE